MIKLEQSKISIIITAMALGLLIALQARSFEGLGDVLSREKRTDVFREIQVLKETNTTLEDEISELERQLDKVSNNQEALESVRQEIEKYRKLTGRVDISGPGVAVTLDGDVKLLWLTDIVNELFSAGADAVSVNSIRLTNTTVGFDLIPSGQILLNSVILNKPYTIEAIGERSVLEEALNQPQGIVERMKQTESGISVEVAEDDLIEMKKVI